MVLKEGFIIGISQKILIGSCRGLAPQSDLNIRFVGQRRRRWRSGLIYRYGAAQDTCSIGHPIDPHQDVVEPVGHSHRSIGFIASDVPQFGG